MSTETTIFTGMARTFIISRTDAIGDVVLTLPVAGVLRSLYPQSRIYFLGRSYTEEVINACTHVDGFLNWDEWKTLPDDGAARALAGIGADTIVHVFPDKKIARLARQAGIRQRIGTTNRMYHWLTCNRLLRLSRRHSPFHEAQLNLQLLAPLGADELYPLHTIARFYGLTKLPELPASIATLPETGKFNLVLHPKSRGSAREWGLDNFRQLIRLLPRENFRLFITGTAAEGGPVQPLLQEFPFVTDLTGRLGLGQLMTFISVTDGLLAASTGPLHLAAALGRHAIGIYPPIKPMHPGRWAPVGAKTKVFVRDGECETCRKSGDCTCMRGISPQSIKDYLLTLLPPNRAGETN